MPQQKPAGKTWESFVEQQILAGGAMGFYGLE